MLLTLGSNAWQIGKKKLSKYQFLRIIYKRLYLLRRDILSKFGASIIKQFNFPVLIRDDLIARDNQRHYIKYGSTEITEFKRAYAIEPVQDNLLPAVVAQKIEYPQPFVCEIENAEIIGNPPLALDSEGNIILETGIPRYFSIESYIAANLPLYPLILRKFFAAKIKRITEVDTVCLFWNIWNNNYFYWTADLLTRLEGLEYYRQQTGIKPKLIVESNMRSWQKESLKLLGYTQEDFVIWNQKGMLVKKLVIPSIRRAYSDRIYGEISYSGCRWLRQQILSNLPEQTETNTSFSDKILISRRKALSRSIFNEDEVMEALTPLGFSAYVLEEMSFTEQVRLFAQAKMIIAPHGAGLVNILYAKNASVVELFGSVVNTCAFANLARGLDFKYGCLSCPSPKGETRQKDGDIVVNTSQLLSLIKMMS